MIANTVCGPLTTTLSVSHSSTYIDNQQYLPGTTNAGAILSTHNSANSGC